MTCRRFILLIECKYHKLPAESAGGRIVWWCEWVILDHAIRTTDRWITNLSWRPVQWPGRLRPKLVIFCSVWLARADYRAMPFQIQFRDEVAAISLMDAQTGTNGRCCWRADVARLSAAAGRVIIAAQSALDARSAVDWFGIYIRNTYATKIKKQRYRPRLRLRRYARPCVRTVSAYFHTGTCKHIVDTAVWLQSC